ncbi:MAG TPA: metallophosphoesterase family protein [Gaiellaceae bacterium]|nr:metallophosphoesterase family protein [Gaiellaceae bacterium]
MLGLLYDVHGNLPALEAVLADAEALGVDSWLLGGDYGIPSPWPLETLERLEALPNATWIRGNGERWSRELPDIPEIRQEYEKHVLGVIPDDVLDRLYRLPAQAELDGTLYVHGSPLSDVESFAPQPEPDEERLLARIRDRTVVFGHSHQQFRRPGPNGTDLVNPGSAGMPLDGDRRPAWATRNEDFNLRRTEYDVERAVAGFRALGGEFSDVVARRLLNGSD